MYDGQIDGRTYGETDERKERCADGRSDVQDGRQTDRVEVMPACQSAYSLNKPMYKYEYLLCMQ